MHSNPIQFANQAQHEKRRTAPLALLLVAVGLSLLGPIACVSPAAPPLMAKPVPYRVGAPDQILISILPEPVIERVVTVRPDGKVSLDLIGDLQAAGMTPEEIAESVRVEIGRFKRNASVTVTVIAAESDTITLFGEVRSPGTFPIQHDIRVAEAIAQLGGTTNFASKRNVRVIRAARDPAQCWLHCEPVILQVNLSRIQSGDLSSNIQLLSGDIVVVPPTILARIGYVLQQILFPFQPVIQAGAAYRNTTSLPGL
ncbi:MAG: polysaccharide biosynthesis/export family protein [Myxococcales bacterium]|nr:polysaccharide biosynthesis/export family protein [Myxococcales bacterium]